MTEEQLNKGKELSELIKFHEDQRAYFDRCAIYLANDALFNDDEFRINTPYGGTPLEDCTVRRNNLSDLFIKEGKYHLKLKLKYESQFEKL